MTMIRVLHISDLHAKASDALDQRLLVREMLRDVARLHAENAIDLVIFTGDLTFGAQADQFALAQELLLAPMERDLGIERTRIVLTPGNHDVDRNLIDRYAERGLTEELDGRDAVNQLLDNAAELASATRRLDPWRRFSQDYYAAESPSVSMPLANVHSFTVRGVSVGVASLNSAWRASGGPEDERRLLVGGRQIQNALSHLDQCAVRCAAMHHPLDWLSPHDSDNARREFERQRMILLTGHLHVSNPESVVSARGSVVFSQAGSLYETRDHLNSYTVLDIDPSTSKVVAHVRTWWPDRGEFDQATNLAPGGTVTLSLAQNALAARPDTPMYMDVLLTLGSDVRDRSVIADRLSEAESVTVDDLLVAPRFWPVPHREVVLASREHSRPNIQEADPLSLLAEHSVLLLGGDPESGVTSALYWILDKHYRSSESHFPVYVQFDSRFDKKKMDRAIIAALSAAGFANSKQLPIPPLLCAIDDVNLRDPRAVGRLCDFIRVNPQHRYVLASRLDTLHGLARTLKGRDVEFGRVFLGPFGRGDQRKMIEKIVGPGAQGIATRVARVIRGEGLPRSPFHLAVLISVLALEANPNLVNESTILLSYVDHLLGRGELVDSEGLGMDYRLREHALGAFANHLYASGRARLHRVEAEAFFANYFQQRGLTAYSPGNLVNSLLRRRVLMEDIEGVGFRHPAVEYLFVGKWMREDPQFEAVVLSDPIGNGNVVHHAAALRRSDRALLQATLSDARDAVKAVSGQVRIEHFDAIRAQPGWSNRPSLEQLKILLQAPTPTPEELDQQLDAVDDRSEAGMFADSRFLLPPALDRMARAVQLLADVLRSSELVDDLVLKQESLRFALHGWGLIEVVVAVREDQTHFLHELFGQLFGAEPTKADAESMIDHLVTEWIALLTAVFAAASLGSSHVKSLLTPVMRDGKFMKSTAHALFATMLASQLQAENWAELLADLYERHRRHPVAHDFSLSWALLNYREGRGTGGDLKRLEEFLADVYTQSIRFRGREAVVKRARARDEVIRQLREGSSKAKGLTSPPQPIEHEAPYDNGDQGGGLVTS